MSEEVYEVYKHVLYLFKSELVDNMKWEGWLGVLGVLFALRFGDEISI